jgi:hypothetical protein
MKIEDLNKKNLNEIKELEYEIKNYLQNLENKDKIISYLDKENKKNQEENSELKKNYDKINIEKLALISEINFSKLEIEKFKDDFSLNENLKIQINSLVFIIKEKDYAISDLSNKILNLENKLLKKKEIIAELQRKILDIKGVNKKCCDILERIYY